MDLRGPASGARTATREAGRWSLRPLQSCGVAEVVGCNLSDDGRESPAQLLELALLGMERELGRFCVSPELPQLERECLEPPNELGELRTSARPSRSDKLDCAVPTRRARCRSGRSQAPCHSRTRKREGGTA